MNFSKEITLVFLILANNVFAQRDNMELINSIANTKNFLNNSEVKSHQILIFLNYLERAYGVNFKFSTEEKLKQPAIYDDEKEDIKYFYRSFNRNYKVNLQELDLKEDVLKLMVWSLYSDKIKISRQYESILNNFSKKQDKYLTHAAISLGWLIEQNQTNQLQSFDVIKNIIIDNLKQLAEKENYIGDTGFEALVGLIMLGESAYISEEIISKIISAQLPDGGFQYHVSETNVVSNQHTSFLALWVLLNYKNNGLRKDNFVTKK